METVMISMKKHDHVKTSRLIKTIAFFLARIFDMPCASETGLKERLV